MVYLPRYDFDLNDPSSFQEICTAPIQIMQNSNSPYNQHHHKDQHFDEYLINNGRISSYTEFLSTDNMMEAYGIITHATSCSSPESDCDYMFINDKIKLEEYSEPLDASIYNMSRTLSSDSCPELSGCSHTTPLTPPQDQSPTLPPNGLPMPHHQYQPQQTIINEERDMLTNQVMVETPTVNTTKRGRGRRAASSTMQLQDSVDYQLVGSSLPSPPQKTTTGKSRGRRMSNKPTKPGTKSFECTYAGCGRVFKRSEHLKRHIRSIHTLERPFHCPHPHCSKRFSRSDNLSQHVRVHRSNGKEKNATARTFSNFTPFLQTYQQAGGLQSLQQ